MNYILSVEEKLGPLSFCRIWHDNSGEGKHRSWFLDQIEMSDLQTGERYRVHLYNQAFPQTYFNTGTESN